MDDLVQWLRDRLDEDERTARASVEQASVNLAGAEPSSVSVWHVVDRPATGTFVATRDQWERVAEVVPTYGGAHADHIVTHDPARVLREIDAKRQLIDELERCGPKTHGYPGLRYAVQCLALPYADRPGYRDEWRP